MKTKLKNLIVLLLVTNITLAQEKITETNTENTNTEKVPMQVQTSKFGINLSTGIDNPHGFLGIGLNVKASEKILVTGGVGLSTWGSKLAIRGLYFLKPNFLGSAFGISINRSTGFSLDNYSAVTTNNTAYGTVGGVFSSNAMYALYFKISPKSRFYMQTGLAFKISKPDMDLYIVNSSVPVMEGSAEYNAYKVISPGGFVLNFGFDLGF